MPRPAVRRFSSPPKLPLNGCPPFLAGFRLDGLGEALGARVPENWRQPQFGPTPIGPPQTISAEVVLYASLNNERTIANWRPSARIRGYEIGADGKVLVRRQLRRAEVLKLFSALPSCPVGMEACASGHHWGRELIALGHDVRLMPPAYVKPYVKRGKTDAADAEAICEAATRPTMRFMAVKTPEQQAVLMLHKTRDLLVRQRTGLINALRAHLAEYGIISGKGPGGVTVLMKVLHEAQERLPAHARSALHTIGSQLRALASEVQRLEA